MFIDRFISQYIAPCIRSGTVLIGIDGGQGAGKTCFIAELKKALTEVNVIKARAIITIETDDFLIERNKREHLSDDFFDNISNLCSLFNFQRMAQTLNLFTSLYNTQHLLSCLYNTSTGQCDRSSFFSFKEQNIILVGGPYLLESSYPIFNLRVFLYADEQTRLNCILERNKNRFRSSASQKKLFQNFEKFYMPYFNTRICEYDIIVDNTDFNARKIIQSL